MIPNKNLVKKKLKKVKEKNLSLKDDNYFILK